MPTAIAETIWLVVGFLATAKVILGIHWRLKRYGFECGATMRAIAEGL